MLLSLDVADREVVVAGGGAVAARRVRALLDSGARVTVISPEAGDDVTRLASHGDIRWERRRVRPEDLDGVWLAIAATDDPDVNLMVARWASDRRVWCVNSSDGFSTSARVAAVSRHGDLAVGVVSEGAPDPSRVARVRDSLGALLDEGQVDLRRVRGRRGRVVLVGSGPGSSDLITVRGARLLAEADVVVTDRLGATGLLAALPETVEVINVGKSPDNHPVPQHEINDILVDRARKGLTVIRLKGGDPFVFGRGGEEVHACVEADIPVEVVPGITSALSAPALAGIPPTQRGIAASVLITSGHAGPEPAVRAALGHGVTVIVLMGVAALPAFVEAALEEGADPSTPVAILESATTARERVTHGTVSDIVRIAGEMAVKPPAVIVIGKVAEPELLASALAATPRP
ncbi:uroporphyrinogen-III C-methyltransferase [Demequina zhanjiangensis]|uniref:Uroporphyrinogen-III C-methyltransferase n=1 Tax=Demequina zhanjiangensis TaxID=3051659 RepID=A0ABT8FZX9_9MICO|nr:uroporphyrinogen-III C-methyltransferase [Demequina sp. SYSU T00b26]MDN4472456.1 uroporphyrinogen-III C-methyltransferase [Demequina sp. SYSU T00b26]